MAAVKQNPYMSGPVHWVYCLYPERSCSEPMGILNTPWNQSDEFQGASDWSNLHQFFAVVTVSVARFVFDPPNVLKSSAEWAALRISSAAC